MADTTQRLFDALARATYHGMDFREVVRGNDVAEQALIELLECIAADSHIPNVRTKCRSTLDSVQS